MLTTERLYTVEELWALSHDPAYADKRLELTQGRLIVMSPTGGEHGILVLRLGARILAYVEEHQLGVVVGAETGFILYHDPDDSSRDVVRAPDVGFIARGRVPDPFPKKYIPFAPDLAAEIISPSESAADIYEKVQEYLRYGTRMVLLVYPSLKSAALYTPSGYQALTIDNTFEGEDVLPGFSLPLNRLFG